MKLYAHIRERLIGRHLDVRVRLFNVLAMTGIVIGLISTAACIVNNENIFSITANISSSFIAFGIMFYASRTGRFQVSYMLTIIIIFMAILPLIFFIGGGYNGAMLSYFIFAVVFTVFMLEGKKAVCMVAAEMLVYSGLCIYAYFNPDKVTVINTALYKVTDIIIGFTAVSVSLGVVMLLLHSVCIISSSGSWKRHGRRCCESARLRAASLLI